MIDTERLEDLIEYVLSERYIPISAREHKAVCEELEQKLKEALTAVQIKLIKLEQKEKVR